MPVYVGRRYVFKTRDDIERLRLKARRWGVDYGFDPVYVNVSCHPQWQVYSRPQFYRRPFRSKGFRLVLKVTFK